MFELVLQVLAYSGVGLGVLIGGFYLMDALTPGRLGQLIADGNPNASILAATTLLSLGLVMWFAIFFTGAGWRGLDDAAVFGAVGVALQGVGFWVVELLIPERLRDCVLDATFHPQTAALAGAQVAIALIICASLT
jgi:uncharacterized membrane protein YjfL (UPF0719 family)